MNRYFYKLIGVSLVVANLAVSLNAQTTQMAATFGQVINLGYTPSDVVLDESRGVLYLVNTNSNRIDFVSTSTQKVLRSIPVSYTHLTLPTNREV